MLCLPLAFVFFACSASVLSLTIRDVLPEIDWDVDAAMELQGHFHCDPKYTPGAIWKQSPRQFFNASHNICIDGKHVPDLYVLGAPKCATTALAYEMISAGTRCAGGIKEFHFFKTTTLHQYYKRPDKLQGEWLDEMPMCPSERALMGDYSPESLSLTDGPGHEMYFERAKREMPVALAGLYGDSAPRLNFVVMVREPVSRAQSAFHYTGGVQASFRAEVEMYLAKFKPGDIENNYNPIWGSSYGFQLERWLEAFDHSQFYVIPFRAFAQGNARRVCLDLTARIHYNIVCGDSRTPQVRNRGKHNSLEVELGTDLMRQFRGLMEDDRQRLLHQLTLGSRRGMGLALYDGAAANRTAIREWLDQWW